MTSICLTIFNKAALLPKVLDGIFHNATIPFELNVCLDNCSDNSEQVLLNYVEEKRKSGYKLLIALSVVYGDNWFETKSNNACAKRSVGEFCIFIQDDDVIQEPGFDLKLLRPFSIWPEVFAVSGHMAHNFTINRNSPDFNTLPYINNRWAETLSHHDHAKQANIGENEFVIRNTCNRSPLAIRRSDLVKLNYFDESFVQDCDDHSLIMRAKIQLKKIVGAVAIKVERDLALGGTRDEKGNTKPWLFELYHKNSIILANKYGEVLGERIIETRIML